MTAPPLVFDTTCPSYFARADVLGDLLVGAATSVPHVVREEIRDGCAVYPALTRVLDVEWLRVVPLDTLDRLRRFTIWTGRVGAGARDLGEASVLAVAEEFGAVALIDDRDATRVGRAHGVEVHGTLWLLGPTDFSEVQPVQPSQFSPAVRVVNQIRVAATGVRGTSRGRRSVSRRMAVANRSSQISRSSTTAQAGASRPLAA
jgi:hypothetical protein